MGNQFNTGYLKKHRMAIIAVSVLIAVLLTVLIVARSNKVKQNEQEAAITEQETAVLEQSEPASEIGLAVTEQEQSEPTSAVEQSGQEPDTEQSRAEKEQLETMGEYLGRADQTIVENQESLARAGLMQAETQQSLSDLSEKLSLLEDSMLCVENLVDRHAEKLAGQNGEMAGVVSELSANGQETISQIRSLSSSVSSLLSDLKKSGAGNFASASEKMSELQEALSQAEKNTKEYHDSLVITINLLQQENGEEHKELVQALDTVRRNAADTLEKGFSGVLSQMEQEYGSLMEKLGTLHDQITGTRKDISELLKFIETSDAEKQDETRKSFADIMVSIGQIQSDYADARQEVSALIKELGAAQSADHAETLAVLLAMEDSMTENSMRNLENITASVQGMADSLSVSMSGMQGEMSQGFSVINSEMSRLFSEYNIYMTERLDFLGNQLMANGQDSEALTDSMKEEMTQNFLELENRLEGMFEQLDRSIAEYNRAVMDMADNHDIEKKLDILGQEIEQVFQSVSDGRGKLASALLTKGVSISKDATFDEIYRAILNIRQDNGYSGENGGAVTEGSAPEKETETVSDSDPEKETEMVSASDPENSEPEVVEDCTGIAEGDDTEDRTEITMERSEQEEAGETAETGTETSSQE